LSIIHHDGQLWKMKQQSTKNGRNHLTAHKFNFHLRGLLTAALFLVLTPFGASAQSPSGATANSEAAPKLEYVFEEVVTLDKAVVVGDTAFGHRQYIPITGGSVTGPRLKGKVLSGGWDWQLQLANGCTSLAAEYKLQAEDGAIIYVSNKGLLCGAGKVFTRPVFEAPKGAYEWMTEGTFIGVLSGAGDADHPAVRITFYQAK
jgi:hypothetical protein